MKLRHYQEAAKESGWHHLRTREDNPCLVIPTGGGKSPLMAAMTSEAVSWGKRVMLLADRKELLEQNRDKLIRYCPTIDVGVYSAGIGLKNTSNRVIVAGIQSVWNKAAQIGSVDLAIVDECFTGETTVDTPEGQVEIKHITPGDRVLNALGDGVVLSVSRKTATHLVRVRFDDGSTIRCTPEHRFFTESGWKHAATLDVGEIAFGAKAMSDLREFIQALEKGEAERWVYGLPRDSVESARMLFSILCEEAEEPNEQPSNQIEGGSETKGDKAQANQTGWKRTTVAAAAISTASYSRGRLGVGSCSGNEDAAPENRISDKLQNRHSEQGDNASCRNRRSKSPRETGTGCTQAGVLGVKRVASVSPIESTGTRFVYNLHVSGHPSYFAGGVLVHNCHTIQPEGEGRYGSLLKDLKIINPKVRLIGLTATPYRMKEGLICGPDHLLNHICYEIGVKQLIDEGFLCKLISKRGLNIDFSGLHIKAGEYVEAEVNAIMLPLVSQAIEEMLKLSVGRKSILIFCQGIDHAQAVQIGLEERTKEEVGLVTGMTLPGVRREILERFKQGKLKYVVNVNVLTTGFDAPNIDCVVLLRPTASPGLYYQMVGRAFRPDPSKENALVLDFGGNVERHGPVDAIEAKRSKGRGKGEPGEPMVKACPKCQLIQAVSYLKCPECGHEWPPRELKHETTATSANILSEPERFTVTDVSYNVHRKKGSTDDDPCTLRVTYAVGVGEVIEEWVCLEHPGWNRKNAVKWWKQRSNEPCPATAADAVRLGVGGFMATPIEIVATKRGHYWKCDSYVFGELPESSASLSQINDEDVPF